MNGTNGNTTATNGHETPVLLPSAKPFNVTDTITIQPPLTRRGHGPGLLILVPSGIDLSSHEKTLDPPPLQKWAEEGFAVAQLTVDGSSKVDLDKAVNELQKLKECDAVEKLGLISYNAQPSQAIESISRRSDVVGVVHFGSQSFSCSQPQLWHAAGTDAGGASKNVKVYKYPDCGPHFIIPAHDGFKSASAAVAWSRTLAFLKPLTNGPWFNLEAIWDEHTAFEFQERAVEKTMGTMVQEPYVNHVPTITGGIGRARLTDFYRHHFVYNNPDDTKLELVSRTVGIDRVIDEFVFSFTHDREIDWLLPGIPPTGRHVQVCFTGVINIRGDRLYHEHIAWDQATVLRQIGLLPEYLPFPYALPDGRKPAPGKRFEYRVPTAGVETAQKMFDERSVESNQMFDFKIREVDDK